jgi:hypothetical protein
MEEIDLDAAEPMPLIGWSLKAGARDELVLCLEYGVPGQRSDLLTLAVPWEAIRPLAEELARWIAQA